MAVSVSILAVVTSLHLLAFVFAFGAERRRSTVPFSLYLSLCLFLFCLLLFFPIYRFFFFLQAVAVPDKYDEKTFCVYGTVAATVYGMSAFGLLLVSQAVVNGVTKCLCFGKGLVTGTSYTVWSIVFFVVSW